MKIKKILEKENFEIIRTNKNIIYKLNDNIIEQKKFKDMLLLKFLNATETRLNLSNKEKNVKGKLKKLIKNFINFKSEMKLEGFIFKTLEIIENDCLYGKIMYKDILNSWESKEDSKVYIKYNYINQLLDNIYGKPFKLLIGHIYHNHKKTIKKISNHKKSHLNKLINSFEKNKMDFNKKFNFNISKNQINFVEKELKDFIIPKKNLEKDKIRTIDYLVKIDKNGEIKQLYLDILKIIKKKIISLTENKKFDSFAKQYEKFYNAIKKDLLFLIVNKIDYKKCNKENLRLMINKLINTKIEVFNVRKNQQQTFIHPAQKFLNEQNPAYIDDYNIISSHSINKFYRNLATIVGCSIINYKLQNENEFKIYEIKNKETIKKEMYDFSMNSFENCLFKSNYLKWKIPILNNIEIKDKENIKIASLYALQEFRNSIMHIKNLTNEEFFKKTNEIVQKYKNIKDQNMQKDINFDNFDIKKELEKLYSILVDNKNNVIKSKFKNRKIPIKEIYYYDGNNLSLSYNRILKKLINITVNNKKYKHDINMESNWNFLESFNSDNFDENVDSKKFILKWIYENDFQIWLNNQRLKHFDIDKFKNWYKTLFNKNKKLSYPNFIENYVNIEKLYFESNSYLSEIKNKNKEEKYKELEKKQAFVENVWIFIFDNYLAKNQKEILIKLNQNNFINNDMEYTISNNNSFEPHWFLLSCINLNNYELSKMLKYIENYYNRMFKNKRVLTDISIYNFDVQYLLNEKNILNLIKNIKLLKINNENLEQYQDLKLNENEKIIWKMFNNKEDYEILNNEGLSKKQDYEDEKKNNVIKNSTHKNVIKLIDYYRSGWYDQEFKIIQDYWEKNKFPNINKNEIKVGKKGKELEIAKINRYNNRQTFVKIFELIKEIKYMYINWVMHREFYYENYILDNLGNIRKIIVKIQNCKKNKFENLKINLSKEVEKLLKITNVMPNQTKENIKNYYNKLKNFVTDLEYSDCMEFKFKEFYLNLLNTNEIPTKLKDIIKNVEKELFVNSELKHNLNLILHLNHAGNINDSTNKFNTIISAINTLRNDLDYKRNLKNQITPSIERLFEKNYLKISFKFDNHNIIYTNIESKISKVKDYNNKTIDNNLIRNEELKLYKLILNIKDENS